MQEILIFGLGIMVGAAIGVVIMSLLNISKKADLENEKLMEYKNGYQKGFDDGYDLQKSHTK
jgi:uncharacterized membrane-anchored protein YhcB (DUF1043 family)